MENYRQWLEARRWLVLAGLSVLLFAYAILSAAVPLAGELFDLANAIKANQQKIHLVEGESISVPQLKRRNEKLARQIEQLVSSQNRETQLSPTLAFLNAAAKNQGCEILTLEPQPLRHEARHVALPIHLELAASFHALGRFLNAIETGTKVIKITQLKIATVAITAPVLQVKMTLVVYYLTS